MDGINERWLERLNVDRPADHVSVDRETWTGYFRVKRYHPIIARLKETGLSSAYEFKEKNDNGGKVEILNKSLGKTSGLEKSKRFLCA